MEEPDGSTNNAKSRPGPGTFDSGPILEDFPLCCQVCRLSRDWKKVGEHTSLCQGSIQEQSLHSSTFLPSGHCAEKWCACLASLSESYTIESCACLSLEKGGGTRA